MNNYFVKLFYAIAFMRMYKAAYRYDPMYLSRAAAYRSSSNKQTTPSRNKQTLSAQAQTKESMHRTSNACKPGCRWNGFTHPIVDRGQTKVLHERSALTLAYRQASKLLM